MENHEVPASQTSKVFTFLELTPPLAINPALTATPTTSVYQDQLTTKGGRTTPSTILKNTPFHRHACTPRNKAALHKHRPHHWTPVFRTSKAAQHFGVSLLTKENNEAEAEKAIREETDEFYEEVEKRAEAKDFPEELHERLNKKYRQCK